MDDLTVIYYSACVIEEGFAEAVREDLKEVLEMAGNPLLISVTQKPVKLGRNVCVGPIGKSIPNVYKQIEIGAKLAKTPYIAMAEDDTLYLDEHFKKRPVEADFTYNVNRWNLHTRERVYSRRETPVTGLGIFKREEFLKLMGVRRVYRPEPIKKEGYFGEPGYWDKKHKIPGFTYETFKTEWPCVVICHRRNLGGRKYLTNNVCDYILPWGEAETMIRGYYETGRSLYD